jgi:flagellar hook-associated protein 1 FlgK
MLAYQRAYEGAARVLTAIDEMLDTLINRTGVVGR